MAAQGCFKYTSVAKNVVFIINPLNQYREISEMITDQELNFFFREGDDEHLFETGQRKHKPWRGKSEATVLIARAASGKKPVAEIVIQPNWNKGQVTRLIKRVRHHKNLKFNVIKNDWNMDVMYITAMPKKTLAALFSERGDDTAGLKLRPEVEGRNLEYYVSLGFDMSSIQSPVSALESALLLGYPLDLAKEHAAKHSCGRKH
jgi:hypothetical protein